MKRIVFLAVLAAFAAIAVVPASAEGTQEFKAEFNEMHSCPGVDLCGKGIVHGFGTVTTTLVFCSRARLMGMSWRVTAPKLRTDAHEHGDLRRRESFQDACELLSFLHAEHRRQPEEVEQ